MIFLLQFILIVIFSIVVLQKIMGDRQQINIFNDLKLPQWLRVVTGVAGLIIGFLDTVGYGHRGAMVCNYDAGWIDHIY